MYILYMYYIVNDDNRTCTFDGTLGIDYKKKQSISLFEISRLLEGDGERLGCWTRPREPLRHCLYHGTHQTAQHGRHTINKSGSSVLGSRSSR